MLLAWAVQRGTALLTTSKTPSRIKENFDISTLPEDAMKEISEGIKTRLRFNAVVRPGRPATFDRGGQILTDAVIGCTISEVFEDIRTGHPIWFDDGKIGGVVEKVEKTPSSRSDHSGFLAGQETARRQGYSLGRVWATSIESRFAKGARMRPITTRVNSEVNPGLSFADPSGVIDDKQLTRFAGARISPVGQWADFN